MTLAPKALAPFPWDVKLQVLVVRHACAYTDRAPAIEVVVPTHAHHRTIAIALYLLAAAVEAASLEESWDLHVEEFRDHKGRIVVQLATESHSEMVRALQVLREVAERARGG
jgi:hypothetical protein